MLHEYFLLTKEKTLSRKRERGLQSDTLLTKREKNYYARKIDETGWTV